MNKKIIALAVAAAVAPAFAMADSGNVTVYGQANASYDMIKMGGATTAAGLVNNNQSLNRISDNASRLGFKGTEDLGNGLSAIWQMEAAVNLDDSTTNSLTNRDSFVGLSSKTAGTVILGRHDTPYKMATRGLDQFGETQGDARSIMGGGVNGSAASVQQTGLGTYSTAQTAAMNFDARQSNVAAYITPTMSGFTGVIAYVAASEQSSTNGAGQNQTGSSAYSLAGMYSNGPLFASLAYEKHALGQTATGGLAAVNANLNESAWKLGVGYKIDAFDIGFAYEKTSDDFGGSGLASATCAVAGQDCNGHHAYQLGGGYTFGSNKIKLQYIKAGTTANADRTGAADDDGAKMWALGFDHNMSKRTRLYAVYTKLNNDVAGTYQLTNGGNGTAANANLGGAGSSPSALSFGMKHSF